MDIRSVQVMARLRGADRLARRRFSKQSTLISVSRKAFECAKGYFLSADALIVTSIIFGVFSALSLIEADIFIVSIITVIPPIALLIRSRGTFLRMVARRSRYTALLSEAYGQNLDENFVSTLGVDVGDRFVRDALRLYGSREFYDKTRLPPHERLRKLLYQSAFWSSRLYKFSSQGFFLLFFGMAVLCGALVLITLSETGTSISLTQNMLVLLVSSLFGIDLFGRAMSWRSAWRDTQDILVKLQARNVGEPELMLLLVRYQTSVVFAPLLPTASYAILKGQIQKEYEDLSV